MREVSFVKKLKFDFNGSVTKRALVIGDADNDGCNELVCANLLGDLAIFKGASSNKVAYAQDLGMITACAIGDSTNAGRNFVISMNMEGWLFIFDVEQTTRSHHHKSCTSDSNVTQDTSQACDNTNSNCLAESRLQSFYEQRMPSNCKEILLADLDGDGQNELIIGLTDRVLRTYKWIDIDDDRGKFVGLYKWEFADQIGSVSLNPSRCQNCMDIIVAQPGGTYARLECFDKKPIIVSPSSTSSSSSRLAPGSSDHTEQTEPDPNDNVKTEYINKLTPEYHQLALAQMRNHHISTEVLGGIKSGKNSESYSTIVIATLDGTLMLVNKDEILWSLQVDHQLFALAVIEKNKKIEPSATTSLPQSKSTRPPLSGQQKNSPQGTISRQYLAVCAWNGKTYIVDEERNYLRFKFNEAVSAFTAGSYHFDDKHHSALVYATFNNQIILFYDVVPDNIRPKYMMDELINNPQHENLRATAETMVNRLGIGSIDDMMSNDAQSFRNLIHDILYGVMDEELSQ